MYALPLANVGSDDTAFFRSQQLCCSHCNCHTGVVIVTVIITTTVNTICNAIRNDICNAIKRHPRWRWKPSTFLKDGKDGDGSLPSFLKMEGAHEMAVAVEVEWHVNPV
jgi:hypothetical protein